jgi:hypothetical protein
MKTFFNLAIFVFLSWNAVYSQVSVNTDGSVADPSAILDVKSTSRGVLFPRMTFNERNAIVDPAEGLFIFCTNCGPGETGTLCLFSGGEWLTFNLCKILAPTAGLNQMPPFTIVWTWNPVPGATGYKWGTTNSYGSASDMGTDTSRTETGITCDSAYTRYVWAYNDCGYSLPVTLTQTNPNCWTCGQPISVDHIAGSVAPVSKSTSYGTVSNIAGEPAKCWTTSNLGSDHQATAVNDTTEASAGWYWQFNHARGFKHSGLTRNPSSTWITSISEMSNWVSENDPCVIELGNGFRIPTTTEWSNADAFGGWSTWDGPWNSSLKLHAAGRLTSGSGALEYRGEYGYQWSSVQSSGVLGQVLYFFSTSCTMSSHPKAYAYNLRCIKE